MSLTPINSTQLLDLVQAKVLDYVNAGKDFTAKTIKDDLREDYPNVVLTQAEVRYFVAEVFAALVDYTSEMRQYDDGQGGKVWATTYFPVPSQAAPSSFQAIMPPTPSTPPVPSQSSSFFSALKGLLPKDDDA